MYEKVNRLNVEIYFVEHTSKINGDGTADLCSIGNVIKERIGFLYHSFVYN